MKRSFYRATRPMRNGQRFNLSLANLKKFLEPELTILFIINMKLFGLFYRDLRPEYFDKMPHNSGVFVRLMLPIQKIINDATFPGDIDILLIPYEENMLILNECVALEVKIVRASYRQQNKSPDRFGITQARALLTHGIPYAGVVHLIVSDESPRNEWREFGRCIKREDDRADILPSVKFDGLPIDLMNRSFGRLKSNVKDDDLIGYGVVYLPDSTNRFSNPNKGTFFPIVEKAKCNPSISESAMKNIYSLYVNEPEKFLNISRYDP